MQTIGAFEAKTHFSALLAQVEKGEQVLITKHGQPVARLIPIKSLGSKHAQEAIARLKEFSKANTLGGLDWKILRDKGRR